MVFYIALYDLTARLFVHSLYTSMCCCCFFLFFFILCVPLGLFLSSSYVFFFNRVYCSFTIAAPTLFSKSDSSASSTSDALEFDVAVVAVFALIVISSSFKYGIFSLINLRSPHKTKILFFFLVAQTREKCYFTVVILLENISTHNKMIWYEIFVFRFSLGVHLFTFRNSDRYTNEKVNRNNAYEQL